jgi:hypothetical protein
VLVNGKSYRDLTDPLRSVGALLDAKAIVGGRSAANHLMWLADSNGIDRRRVGEVLDIVGLGDVAGKRVGTFSLGMSQRLGIAAALLGDPDTLIFDEPRCRRTRREGDVGGGREDASRRPRSTLPHSFSARQRVRGHWLRKAGDRSHYREQAVRVERWLVRYAAPTKLNRSDSRLDPRMPSCCAASQ